MKCKNCGHEIRKNILGNYIHLDVGTESHSMWCDCSKSEPEGK